MTNNKKPDEDNNLDLGSDWTKLDEEIIRVGDAIFAEGKKLEIYRSSLTGTIEDTSNAISSGREKDLATALANIEPAGCSIKKGP